LDSFKNKIFENLGGTYVTLLCAIGNRLWTWKSTYQISTDLSQF
jgi:hypothetical protein